MKAVRSLAEARTRLAAHKIKYTVEYGRSDFNYTAIVFPTRSKAWKACDIMGLDGPVTRRGEGYGILFY